MLRFLQFFFFLNITFLHLGCNINETKRNWRIINANKTSHLYGIHFFDKKHGWAVGSNSLILKTDDGGLTWGTISQPNALFSGPINKVYFSTKNHGWVIGL
ncbi:MAG: YCF48-related protein, partial [Candidatus Poribacteria bacterium]|nr:YCF48-related protein [Candidatus Poribacteria bacterium]